jgi:hypothetical protein
MANKAAIYFTNRLLQTGLVGVSQRSRGDSSPILAQAQDCGSAQRGTQPHGRTPPQDGASAVAKHDARVDRACMRIAIGTICTEGLRGVRGIGLFVQPNGQTCARTCRANAGDAHETVRRVGFAGVVALSRVKAKSGVPCGGPIGPRAR